jgi:polyisoprenoid-binding protein YceI
MKKLNLLLIGFGLLLASCGGGETAETTNETAPAKEEMTASEATSYTVNTAESNIRWEGGTAGVTVYSHFGNIKLKEGSVEVTGDKITGGTIVVDMKTINPKDEGYSEENTPQDLVGHLSTGDFFLVEEFPTATFEITGSEGNNVMGNLTIRGNTNPETIVVENVTMGEDGSISATGKLVFDRQKYEVKWAHYLKDVVLKDEIDLTFNLVASK